MTKLRMLFVLTVLGIVSLSVVAPAQAAEDFSNFRSVVQVKKDNFRDDKCYVLSKLFFQSGNGIAPDPQGTATMNLRVQRKRDGQWRTIAKKPTQTRPTDPNTRYQSFTQGLLVDRNRGRRRAVAYHNVRRQNGSLAYQRTITQRFNGQTCR